MNVIIVSLSAEVLLPTFLGALLTGTSAGVPSMWRAGVFALAMLSYASIIFQTLAMVLFGSIVCAVHVFYYYSALMLMAV